MNASLIAELPQASAPEGQISEGGANAAYNCVYATVSVILQRLYGHDWEPQDLLALVHPAGHTGGESFDTVAAFLRGRPDLFPNLPAIQVSNPYDTLAAIEQAVQAGYLEVLEVRDDRNGQPVASWPSGWQGTHAVIPLAIDDANVTIWNPWQGGRQVFSRSFIAQSCLDPAGNVMVFQRDIRTTGGIAVIKDWPVADLECLANMMFRATVGRDGSQADLDGAVAAFKNKPANQVYAEYSTGPEAVAYQERLAAAGPPPPAGEDFRPFLEGVKAAWDKLA